MHSPTFLFLPVLYINLKDTAIRKVLSNATNILTLLFIKDERATLSIFPAFFVLFYHEATESLAKPINRGINNT